MATSCRVSHAVLDDLADIQIQLETRIQRAMNALRMLERVLFSEGTPRRPAPTLNMLRNKFGLTKDQAKQLYYDLRSKGKEPEEEPDETKPPESTEEKISVIMETMKQTTVKLDRMEEDIAYLKDQVDKILNKI